MHSSMDFKKCNSFIKETSSQTADQGSGEKGWARCSERVFRQNFVWQQTCQQHEHRHRQGGMEDLRQWLL